MQSGPISSVSGPQVGANSSSVTYNLKGAYGQGGGYSPYSLNSAYGIGLAYNAYSVNAFLGAYNLGVADGLGSANSLGGVNNGSMFAYQDLGLGLGMANLTNGLNFANGLTGPSLDPSLTDGPKPFSQPGFFDKDPSKGNVSLEGFGSRLAGLIVPSVKTDLPPILQGEVTRPSPGN